MNICISPCYCLFILYYKCDKKSIATNKFLVEFEEVTKIYDVKPLFKKIPLFAELERHSELFASVSVDVGGCGIVWNDELDLSCEELWENGNAEKALIEELKIGEKSGEEQGYIDMEESKSRLGL